jgi:hypothetical protein
MEDIVKARLENHAFMATVLRTTGPGMSAAAWLEFVADTVDAFIGDVVVGAESESYRVVLARRETISVFEKTGGDLAPTVIEAINFRLAEIGDRRSLETATELVRMLRRLQSTGEYLECQINGGGFALDFVRGRHSVSVGGRLLAYHVHGATVMGHAFDDGSSVRTVSAEGDCLMLDGSARPFADLAFPEKASVGGEVGKPSKREKPASPLVERIMRANAGSPDGPSPTGMIISKGEDGRVMIALEAAHAPGRLSVRFLPAAVQIISDGTLVAQSGFDGVTRVLGWLVDGVVEVLRLDGGKVDLSRAAVEIRTSA